MVAEAMEVVVAVMVEVVEEEVMMEREVEEWTEVE